MIRGSLDRARAAELLSFWAQRRALPGEVAQARLPEVVCVLRREGAVVGASSAYEAAIELVGSRRFWVYRSLLDEAVRDQGPAMISQTFATLQAEFENTPGAPIGLWIPVSDLERSRRPEAVWSEPHAIHAGYLPDGRQIRIAYFANAQIAPASHTPTTAPSVPPDIGSLLPSGYRIEAFSAQDTIGARDIIELWAREGVLDPEEAQRRTGEILIVATDPDSRPVAVSTTYLRRNDQLRAELWYTRVFVAAEHRRSGLAIAVAHAARDHLVERYRSGIDRRGIGILFEVESEILKRFLPQAIWPRTGFAFIGEDASGRHIRVYYFPGAPVPDPG